MPEIRMGPMIAERSSLEGQGNSRESVLGKAVFAGT